MERRETKNGLRRDISGSTGTMKTAGVTRTEISPLPQINGLSLPFAKPLQILAVINGRRPRTRAHEHQSKILVTLCVGHTTGIADGLRCQFHVVSCRSMM